MKDEDKTKQELADELKKLRHKIAKFEKEPFKKAHDELERQVMVRTADLLNVNKKLEVGISEHTQIEEALLIEKEFTKRLINSSFDGILAFDKNCHFTLWNPGMERISGFNKTDVVGKLAFNVFPFLKETGEDKVFFDILEGKTVIAQDRPYVIP
jgi:PAS domain-containing protein